MEKNIYKIKLEKIEKDILNKEATISLIKLEINSTYGIRMNNYNQNLDYLWRLKDDLKRLNQARVRCIKLEKIMT